MIWTFTLSSNTLVNVALGMLAGWIITYIYYFNKIKKECNYCKGKGYVNK